MAPHPLSPWVYLRRNPRRVLPLLGIQALVTALLIAIITPTNAFRATSETYLRALDHFTVVSPANVQTFDETLTRLLDRNEAMARRLPAKVFYMQTPMIVGKDFAPLLAVEPAERDALLARLGMRLAEGTWPEPDTNGAVIHRTVARARGLPLGEEFGRLKDPSDSTPGRFRVVGILEGDARIGLIDFDYANRPFTVLARTDPLQLVYARPGQKDASDRHLREARDDQGRTAFRVVDAQYAKNQIDDYLRDLPILLGFITICVASVVALVIALLTVIAFQVRVDEFGIHLAVGHRRSRLVRKLVAEAGLVALAGWLIGIVGGLALVWVYKTAMLDHRGIVMQVPDPRPLVFSVSVPFLSALISGLALRSRLHRMDPVAVIQRRGA